MISEETILFFERLIGNWIVLGVGMMTVLNIL